MFIVTSLYKMLNTEGIVILHAKTDLPVIHEEPYTGKKIISFDAIKALTSSEFINSIQETLTPIEKDSIKHLSAEQELWEHMLGVHVYIKTDEFYRTLTYLKDSSDGSEKIIKNSFSIKLVEKMNTINAKGLSLP
jgi:hypothetical protein